MTGTAGYVWVTGCLGLHGTDAYARLRALAAIALQDPAISCAPSRSAHDRNRQSPNAACGGRVGLGERVLQHDGDKIVVDVDAGRSSVRPVYWLGKRTTMLEISAASSFPPCGPDENTRAP